MTNVSRLKLLCLILACFCFKASSAAADYTVMIFDAMGRPYYIFQEIIDGRVITVGSYNPTFDPMGKVDILPNYPRIPGVGGGAGGAGAGAAGGASGSGTTIAGVGGAAVFGIAGGIVINSYIMQGPLDDLADEGRETVGNTSEEERRQRVDDLADRLSQCGAVFKDYCPEFFELLSLCKGGDAYACSSFERFDHNSFSGWFTRQGWGW